MIFFKRSESSLAVREKESLRPLLLTSTGGVLVFEVIIKVVSYKLPHFVQSTRHIYEI